MQTDTKKWIENFNQELEHIQIEFDAFFTAGKIYDYYTLKSDEETGMLRLYFSANKELPKQIEEALSDAFNKSKP